MTAVRTSPGCVSGIHQDHRNTDSLSFVLNVRTQLGKSPTCMSTLLFMPNRGPFANALEVFKGNRGLRVLGLLDNLLRDAVIHILAEARLALPNLHQVALGTLGVLLLQCAAQPRMTCPAFLNAVACPALTIAGGSYVDNPHVNTDCALRLNRYSLRLFNADGEIVVTILKHELSLALAKREARSKSFWDVQGHLLPTTKTPYADTAIIPDSQNPLVIEHGAHGAEAPWLRALPNFVSICHFGENLTSHLCAKRKLFAQLPVSNLMNPKAFEDAMGASCLICVGAGFVKDTHSVAEQLALLG